MAIQLFDTEQANDTPQPLIMMVYGEAGVGKTTFAATAPKPFMADCEGGTKYMGRRGVALKGARITCWNDFREFLVLCANSKEIETIVIDPIGELMEHLKNDMIRTADKKLVQADGQPTAAGWGWLKDTMRRSLKFCRDSGKHVIIIGHVEEVKDEDRFVKRPMIQTKISTDIVNMVDVVGYFTKIVGDDKEAKRIILVDADSDRYTAKDRTGELPRVIPPDFGKIVAMLNSSVSKVDETTAAEEKAEEPKQTADEINKRTAKK